MPTRFDYATAFGRNRGILTDAEQERLRHARLALAGLGGAGGAHLQALLRLGVGSFHLADPDRFELANLNRQWGATLETIGSGKAEALAAQARAVNPELRLRLFAGGVTGGNAGAFLDGVDLVVDAIDFFDIDARRMLMAECRSRGIPAVLAAPVGFAAALLVFPPGASFDEHFGLGAGMTRVEQLVAFAVGLGFGQVPDVDLSRVDPASGKGPAVATACLLAAAMAGTEIVTLLCGRGTAPVASYGYLIDPARRRTLPLWPVPNLRSSAEGRRIRERFFSSLPALGVLHERELAAAARPA